MDKKQAKSVSWPHSSTWILLSPALRLLIVFVVISVLLAILGAFFSIVAGAI